MDSPFHSTLEKLDYRQAWRLSYYAAIGFILGSIFGVTISFVF